jgi:N-acetylglucosaminyldiphosphoundecaprenol N-acetyl-beta-D-mannosaminyltransferase
MTNSETYAPAMIGSSERATEIDLRSRRRSLLGLPIDHVTTEEILELIASHVDRRRPLLQASLNAAKVVQGQTDDGLRETLRRFDLVTADGQAIVWATRLLGCPVPERIAGIDLMDAVVARAAAEGWRVYLLGAKAAIVERTAAALRARSPRLVVAGWRDGYFAPKEESAVVREIREAKADVLFVALGSPAKELFLDRARGSLGIAFGMGVGGAFDVVAGERSRAPRPIQRAGLEWLYRLAQEPMRLGPRYLSSNGRFVALVGREAFELRRGKGPSGDASR